MWTLFSPARRFSQRSGKISWLNSTSRSMVTYQHGLTDNTAFILKCWASGTLTRSFPLVQVLSCICSHRDKIVPVILLSIMLQSHHGLWSILCIVHDLFLSCMNNFIVSELIKPSKDICRKILQIEKIAKYSLEYPNLTLTFPQLYHKFFPLTTYIL